MFFLLPQGSQKRVTMICIVCLGLLPTASLAASVVWNPLEDRYDAQLASTVMIGPKGCVVDKVAKNLTADQIEALFLCDYPDDPEQFAGLYPADGGSGIPTIGGGGGGGIVPIPGVTVKSPTGGTATIAPTGTTSPTGTTTDPIISLTPTDGGGLTTDPEEPTGVTGGTDTQEPSTEGGTTAPTVVPLPAPLAALLFGLACLFGWGKRRAVGRTL